jgi:hypothetical protein
VRRDGLERGLITAFHWMSRWGPFLAHSPCLSSASLVIASVTDPGSFSNLSHVDTASRRLTSIYVTINALRQGLLAISEGKLTEDEINRIFRALLYKCMLFVHAALTFGAYGLFGMSERQQVGTRFSWSPKGCELN